MYVRSYAYRYKKYRGIIQVYRKFITYCYWYITVFSPVVTSNRLYVYFVIKCIVLIDMFSFCAHRVMHYPCNFAITAVPTTKAVNFPKFNISGNFRKYKQKPESYNVDNFHSSSLIFLGVVLKQDIFI